MNKIKSAIQFLFNQNKIVVGLAVLYSQVIAFNNIEWAVTSPSQVAIGILRIELVCLIWLLMLLFAFKVTGRLKQIFGIIPAVIAFFVAGLIVFVAGLIVVVFAISMMSTDLAFKLHESFPGAITEGVLALLLWLLLPLVLSLILFVTKGKSTFFEVKSAEVKPSHQDTDTPEVSQGGSMFCGQCGSQVITSSKFCSKCGSAILAA